MKITELLLLSISGTFISIEALQCYTCIDEWDNYDSACTINTVKCQTYQDTCSTLVSFHATEQSGRSERYHHISKGCDSTQGCFYRARIQNENCIRRDDRDWSCLDCCSGDLCNFYVELSSSTVSASVFGLIGCLCASFFFAKFH